MARLTYKDHDAVYRVVRVSPEPSPHTGMHGPYSTLSAAQGQVKRLLRYESYYGGIHSRDPLVYKIQKAETKWEDVDE